MPMKNNNFVRMSNNRVVAMHVFSLAMGLMVITNQPLELGM